MFVVVDNIENEMVLRGLTYIYCISYCKKGTKPSVSYTNSYDKAINELANLKTHSTIMWIKIEQHDDTMDQPVVIREYDNTN